MAVTTTLLISLKEDIYFLNNLLQQIEKSYKPNELKSWLYPAKPDAFLSKVLSKKTFKNSSYEYCLELALDRVYVLINFFVGYIHYRRPGSEYNLIQQPRKTTLGLCIKLLWINLRKIMQNQASNKKTTQIRENSCMADDKQTQTEICSLNTCDSCNSAVHCMKALMKSFDNTPDRINLQYQIFDITQFGCMLKITSAIEEALNKLYSKLYQEKNEKESLKQENEAFCLKLNEKSTKICFLEEEVNILRKQLETDSQNILKLREERSTLEQNIKSTNEKIEFLKESSENHCVELQTVTTANHMLKKENEMLKLNVEKSIRLLSRCSVYFKKNILKIDKEHELIKSILDQYENAIVNLNNRLAKTTKNLGKIELKVKSNFQDANNTMREFSLYESFCRKIKDVFQEKVIAVTNRNEKPETKCIKGNPVEDISKQIEENRSKIHNLENENIHLQKLLSRFKNIQSLK